MVKLSYICDILFKNNLSFNDYIRKLDFVVSDEKNSNLFFNYCFRLSQENLKLSKEADNIFNSNILGPICFITPELGRWSTIGGLGIMVDELSQALETIGQEIMN